MMALMGNVNSDNWEFYVQHTCIPDHEISNGIDTLLSSCVYDADYYDSRWQHEAPTCVSKLTRHFCSYWFEWYAKRWKRLSAKYLIRQIFQNLFWNFYMLRNSMFCTSNEREKILSYLAKKIKNKFPAIFHNHKIFVFRPWVIIINVRKISKSREFNLKKDTLKVKIWCIIKILNHT